LSIVMCKAFVLLLVMFYSCSFAQEITLDSQKIVIDHFTVPTLPVILVINNQQVFPFSNSASTQSDTILGGERDLLLTVEEGNRGLLLSTDVNDRSWNVQTPNEASGFAIMQYDGIDGSTHLDNVGLNGTDFTVGGATSFRLLIQSDVKTTYAFRIFSGNTMSQFRTDIPPNRRPTEFIINFVRFTGNANFRNVGAFEIEINAFEGVDTYVSFIGTHGPSVVSQSPIPRPSVAPQSKWYTADEDDDLISPCTTNNLKRNTYLFGGGNEIYYYFYSFQDPAENQYVLVANSSILKVSLIFYVLAFLAVLL